MEPDKYCPKCGRELVDGVCPVHINPLPDWMQKETWKKIDSKELKEGTVILRLLNNKTHDVLVIEKNRNQKNEWEIRKIE